MEKMENATGNAPVNNAASAIGSVNAPSEGSPAIAPSPGKAQLAIGFVNRDSDAQLLVRSGDIVTALDHNPEYPAPVPAIATVAAARTAFAAGVTAARGDRKSVV